MAQKTAKTVEDVLSWVETNAHHYGSWVDEPGFFILKGRSAKLRIPEAVQRKALGLIEPGGAFDTRMYRASKAGRARLARASRQGRA